MQFDIAFGRDAEVSAKLSVWTAVMQMIWPAFKRAGDKHLEYNRAQSASRGMGQLPVIASDGGYLSQNKHTNKVGWTITAAWGPGYMRGVCVGWSIMTKIVTEWEATHLELKNFVGSSAAMDPKGTEADIRELVKFNYRFSAAVIDGDATTAARILELLKEMMARLLHCAGHKWVNICNALNDIGGGQGKKAAAAKQLCLQNACGTCGRKPLKPKWVNKVKGARGPNAEKIDVNEGKFDSRVRLCVKPDGKKIIAVKIKKFCYSNQIECFKACRTAEEADAAAKKFERELPMKVKERFYAGPGSPDHDNPRSIYGSKISCKPRFDAMLETVVEGMCNGESKEYHQPGVGIVNTARVETKHNSANQSLMKREKVHSAAGVHNSLTQGFMSSDSNTHVDWAMTDRDTAVAAAKAAGSKATPVRLEFRSWQEKIADEVAVLVGAGDLVSPCTRVRWHDVALINYYNSKSRMDEDNKKAACKRSNERDIATSKLKQDELKGTMADYLKDMSDISEANAAGPDPADTGEDVDAEDIEDFNEETEELDGLGLETDANAGGAEGGNGDDQASSDDDDDAAIDGYKDEAVAKMYGNGVRGVSQGKTYAEAASPSRPAKKKMRMARPRTSRRAKRWDQEPAESAVALGERMFGPPR